jgi:guanine nucleotide-binding protein G(i) subunit alpha
VVNSYPMGLCQAKDRLPPPPVHAGGNVVVSSGIDEFMNSQGRKEAEVKKLLLLGAGESGKSTLFRQARTLFGVGFEEKDRLDYVNTVAENIVDSMQTLIENTPEKDLLALPKDIQEAATKINEIKVHDIPCLEKDVAEYVDKLWKSPAIQKTFDRRSEFQLQDSIRYYCDHLERISASNYVPTIQDILNSRRTTLGVTEMQFVYKGKKLKFVDVGGQRSQRSKWLKQFTGCNAVIFVTAINEYDQVLREDETTNRLMESLYLFYSICQNKDLSKLSLILFLNKSDLFEEKFHKKQVPLTSCFADYNDEGKFDLHTAHTFIANKFVNGDESTKNRDIYTHITCATDTENIRKVMTDLTDILIKEGLDNLGITN